MVLFLLAALTGAPVDPLRFLQTAIRDHQIVFLGDIHPLAEPKLLIASLIQKQREDQAVDVLALEVASEQQEWIDRYLGSSPEEVCTIEAEAHSSRAH